MSVPQGNLLRKRVVTDLATPLARALESSVTGYARLESSDSLLLDAEGVGVVTFESGVPVVAYHTGADSGGTDALADIAVAGPSRVALYELADDALAELHDAPELRVPPGLPAERLAGDPELAERTREAAPESRRQAAGAEETRVAAVEEFLEDEDRIESIRERARDQAATRAEEWGFDLPDS
jgi:hypothetical protein